MQCKKYNCLLVEGGLLDQPVEAWQSVTASGEAYEAWLSERREQQRQAEKMNAVFKRSF
jgi:hypothetical protein